MATNTFQTQNAPTEDRHNGIVLVTEPSRERLNERQRIEYRNHRRAFIEWLSLRGKSPDTMEGYAHDVVKRRAYDTDAFYRWVWSEKADGYTTAINTDHADAYVRELARGDTSRHHKENVVKSLKSLYEWHSHTDEWNPSFSFGATGSHAPRDYLTQEERTAIREAALVYDSIPSYAAMSPDERNKWKHYLAERQGKPLKEVSREDYDSAESFKYVTLVSVSLDTGLRPAEVGNAKTSWLDIDNAVLRIPSDQATKSRESWIVSLRDTTAEMLATWLRERELYDRYENNDSLWLTRHGNPYSSSSLKYVLERLAEVAGIDTENRSLTWYSIRHSVGTYMAREEGLAAAQAQLRHSNPKTTMKYDNTPVEDRRDALDRMG